MTFTIFIVILVVSLAAVSIAVGIYLFIRFIITEMAKRDRVFTFRMVDAVKYIMRGDDLADVLSGVRGWHLNENYDFVEDKQQNPGAPKSKPKGFGFHPVRFILNLFFESVFGVCWLGLPPYRILSYEFEMDELKIVQRPGQNPRPNAQQNVPVDDYQIVHRTVTTDHLRFQNIYGLVAHDIDLKDKIQFDIYGTMTVQIHNALTPIIKLKGKWFAPFRASVEGSLNDFWRKHDYERFQEEPKGNGSEMEKQVIQSNEGDGGLKVTTGMKVVAFDFKKYQPSGNQAEIERALQAKKSAILRGEARIATARAENQAVRLEGSAQAAVLANTLNTAFQTPGGLNAFNVQNVANAIGRHNGPLSLGGGAGMSFLVGDNTQAGGGGQQAVNPQILVVDPDRGPAAGNTEITISGSGFSGNPEVVIGGNQATDIRVLSPNDIRVKTPAGQAGSVDVEVKIGNKSSLLPSSFTYE
jgi:hypothetical protein